MPSWPPAHHHHVCHLSLAEYKARLRAAGWSIKDDFFATKVIAGREAVMSITALPHVQAADTPVKCKLMWLSTARDLDAAYERHCEAIRRRAGFEILDENGRRRASTRLHYDAAGIAMLEFRKP